MRINPKRTSPRTAKITQNNRVCFKYTSVCPVNYAVLALAFMSGSFSGAHQRHSLNQAPLPRPFIPKEHHSVCLEF